MSNHEHIDPFDFVKPCEPDCTKERHAYHQGQWDLAGRINKHWGLNPHPTEHMKCGVVGASPTHTDDSKSQEEVEELLDVLWAFHEKYGNSLSEWKDKDPNSHKLQIRPELVEALNALIQRRDYRKESNQHEQYIDLETS